MILRYAIFLTIICSSIHAQILPDRYRATITDSVVVTSEVLFSTGVPEVQAGGGFYEWLSGLPVNADETDTEPVDLYMDIYQPFGDTLTQRPVVIICFGGGFLSGSRDHNSIVLIAREMAMRGYVAATIDYRLGMNIFDKDLSMRAVYRGIQDGRSAVRFFRADAATSDTYRIDPDHIYIGGHSSGGFIGLHNVYLDRDIERPASTRQWIDNGNTLPDLDSIDVVGDNVGYSGMANGVFSLAGALGYTALIEGGEQALSVLFHSTDDATVPFDQGEPFGNVTTLVFGSDLPVVYGSASIADRCDSVSVDYLYNEYTSRGHDVHDSITTSLYSDIIPLISNFFHSRYLIPEPIIWESDSVACDTSALYTYEVATLDGIYWDWDVDGGTLVSVDSTSTVAVVRWILPASNHAVSATPYNALLARGAASAHSVLVDTPSSATWIGPEQQWDLPSVWTTGKVPQACTHVVLPDQGAPTSITIEASLPAINQQILSLLAGNGVILTLEPGAALRIAN